MKNEVFNNYVKIALEKGLISESQETLEDNSRANKDYADTLETLYGIKLPTNESDKDLLDQAHPDPVFIAPSYDRVNGLVENLRERQDIMVGICNKPTDGNLTMHRYAETYRDLINELVVLGFRMDNKKQKELRVLADTCSYRMTKGAASPAVTAKALFSKWGVLGATAWSISETMGQPSQNLSKHCQAAMTKLVSLWKSASPNIKEEIKTALEEIKELYALVKQTGFFASQNIPAPNTTEGILQGTIIAKQAESQFETIDTSVGQCKVVAPILLGETGLINKLETVQPQLDAELLDYVSDESSGVLQNLASSIDEYLEKMDKSVDIALQTTQQNRAKYLKS